MGDITEDPTLQGQQNTKDRSITMFNNRLKWAKSL